MTKVHHHLLTGFGGAALAIGVGLAVFFLHISNHNIMLRRAQQSVVEVYVGGASFDKGAQGGCSGTYLSNGLVLTARHCVLADSDNTLSKLNTLWVRTYTGQDEAATVAWFSQDNDIALLRVSPLQSKSAPMVCAAPRLGQHVTIIGHPFMVMTWAISEGVVSTNRPFDQVAVVAQSGDVVLTIRGWERMMATSAVDAEGDSGGPVFDDDGNVVGVVAASLGAYSGFIPTSALCAELPPTK